MVQGYANNVNRAAAVEALVAQVQMLQVMQAQHISTDLLAWKAFTSLWMHQVESNVCYVCMQDIKWEFAVKQSDDIEVWSTVGNVMVSTGLLEMVGADDNQLAIVLANEIAHTLARHSVRPR